MSNLKFISTGSTTVTLSGNGLSNSFTANGSAYTLGTAIQLADGEYVQFAGSTSNFSKDSSHYYQFVIGGTGTVTIEGDLISLINNNAYVKQYQFANLFKSCSKITSIANLNFPASIADWCYANMFMDCIGLVNAGTTLPVIYTTRWCYQGMFARCTSLTIPPTILAQKLSPFCYYGMFQGCSSLIEGPKLNNRIVEGDFSTNIMFKDCSNLSTIQVGFTSWPSGNWSRKWLDGVADTGLFVYPNTLASIPADVIPAGWTLSASYPATIVVSNQTFSFDAMSNTNQIKEFGFSYNGDDQTELNIAVNTTNKPVWLTYTEDSNSIDFTANGYSIDSSTSFTLPITFTASDAETKNVVATFNISNYPTNTITVSTIPTFIFDAQSETNIVSGLLSYVTYSGNTLSCEIEGELPTGLSCVDGIITGIPSQFEKNFNGIIDLVYSASDARTVTSSVHVQIINAEPDFTGIPLTFENIGTQSRTITLATENYGTTNISTNPSNNIIYNKNDSGWTNCTFDSAITLDPGDSICFSGDAFDNYYPTNVKGLTFNFGGAGSGGIKIYGDITSLNNYVNTPAPSGGIKGALAFCGRYAGLFCYNTSDNKIEDISGIALPLQSVGYCEYSVMFQQCNYIKNLPSLNKIKEMAPGALGFAFGASINKSISGSVELPNLTTINSKVFCWTFQNCTNIYSAYIGGTGWSYDSGPNGAGGNITNMFKGCSNLSSIEVDWTSWPSGSCADNWVSGVAANGIFKKPAALPTEFGTNRIPSGWTVINK